MQDHPCDGTIDRVAEICERNNVHTYAALGSLLTSAVNFSLVMDSKSSSMSMVLTAFVTCALTASSKVKGFPDCQLCQVGVSLINVAGSPFWNEVIKGVTIVGDATLDLQVTLAKLASQSAEQGAFA